jgi:hypothetical protein
MSQFGTAIPITAQIRISSEEVQADCAAARTEIQTELAQAMTNIVPALVESIRTAAPEISQAVAEAVAVGFARGAEGFGGASVASTGAIGVAGTGAFQPSSFIPLASFAGMGGTDDYITNSAVGMTGGTDVGALLRDNADFYAAQEMAQEQASASRAAQRLAYVRGAGGSTYPGEGATMEDIQDAADSEAIIGASLPGVGMPESPAASTGAFGGLGSIRRIFLAAAAVRGAYADTEAAGDLIGEAYWYNDPSALTPEAQSKLYRERIADGRIVRDEDVLQMRNTMGESFFDRGERALREDLPYVGGVIADIGEFPNRVVSATKNWASGRGFESDLSYGDRMGDVTKEQENHTKILEELADKHKALTEQLEKETTALDRRAAEMGLSGPDRGLADVNYAQQDVAQMLAKPEYHFGGNPNGPLMQGARDYQTASGFEAQAATFQHEQEVYDRSFSAEEAEARAGGRDYTANQSRFRYEQNKRRDDALKAFDAAVSKPGTSTFGNDMDAAEKSAQAWSNDPTNPNYNAANDFERSMGDVRTYDRANAAGQQHENEDIAEHTKELGVGSHAAQEMHIKYEFDRAIKDAQGADTPAGKARAALLESEEQAELRHAAGGVEMMSPMQSWLRMQNAALPGGHAQVHGTMAQYPSGDHGHGLYSAHGFDNHPLAGLYSHAGAAGIGAAVGAHDIGSGVQSNIGDWVAHPSEAGGLDPLGRWDHIIDPRTGQPRDPHPLTAHDIHMEAAQQPQGIPGYQSRVYQSQQQDQGRHQDLPQRIESAARHLETASANLAQTSKLKFAIVGGGY